MAEAAFAARAPATKSPDDGPSPAAAIRHEALERRGAAASEREQARLLNGRPAGPQPIQRAGRPNRTGLPDRLKSGIEALSGLAMDGVKVHYNSPKPAQLNAHAYAQGSDIHLAPGEERHLPHEAWHVVQQAQGRVRPTMQLKDGIAVNADEGLEHEADVMGAKALASAARHERPAEDCPRTPGRATIQRKAVMKGRGTQKRNLKKVKKDLEDARDARGNQQATVDEIDAHDRAQNAGVHHELRPVKLNQLIGDINATLETLTDLNVRDSDLLGVENKAGRGDGQVAVQLRSDAGARGAVQFVAISPGAGIVQLWAAVAGQDGEFHGEPAAHHLHRVGGNEHYKHGNNQGSRIRYIFGGAVNRGNLIRAIEYCQGAGDPPGGKQDCLTYLQDLLANTPEEQKIAAAPAKKEEDKKPPPGGGGGKPGGGKKGRIGANFKVGTVLDAYL